MKVEITKKYTKMEGSTNDLLIGLSCYIDALRANGIPEFLVRGAIEFGLENNECVTRKPSDEKEDPIASILRKIGLED